MTGDNMSMSNLSAIASVQESGLVTEEASFIAIMDFAASSDKSIQRLALPVLNTRLSEAFVASLLCMIVISLVTRTSRRWSRAMAFRSFAEANQCAHTQRELPRCFMASFRNKLHLLRHMDGDLLDDMFAEKYRTFGETHACTTRMGRQKLFTP